VRRHELAPAQAQVLIPIEMGLREAIALLEQRTRERSGALILLGLDPDKVVGGELGDDPHLLVDE
jgi:hypothetical protein